MIPAPKPRARWCYYPMSTSNGKSCPTLIWPETGGDTGAFDVTASIEVTNETSGNEPERRKIGFGQDLEWGQSNCFEQRRRERVDPGAYVSRQLVAQRHWERKIAARANACRNQQGPCPDKVATRDHYRPFGIISHCRTNVWRLWRVAFCALNEIVAFPSSVLFLSERS